jgi:gluconolactonase
MGLEGILGTGSTVRELPRGWDVGGGEGIVAKGCDGPVWVPGHGLAFTDVGHARRLTWTSEEGLLLLHADTAKALGSALDAEGGMVACEHETRRVTRMRTDGSVEVLCDGVDGGPLAGPDDVAIGPDGAVWFTDLRKPFPPLAGAPASGIYRIGPGGGVERALEGLDAPGGLAFSPDSATLYVSEMTSRTIHALDVRSGKLELLASVSGEAETMPQGLAVDERGNVYCAGPGGIWVVAPAGGHLGIIPHPASSTTNLAFGGTDRQVLFFTTAVAAGWVELEVAGAPTPGDAATRPPAGWERRRPLRVERRIERVDARLDAIVAPGTEIEELASGGVFDDLGGGPHSLYARSLEGTVWDSEGGYLFLSDIGNDRRLRWSPAHGVSVLHPHTNHTNGATLDNDRAVISCEHSARRVSRLGRDGRYSIVADRVDGKRLGRPNDVVVRSDGHVYFTNPWWDFGSGDESDLEYPTFCHVAPDGRIWQGPAGYVVPNGLALTPDESVLYVNDSRGPAGLGPNIKAYDVAPDGTVDAGSERVFFRFHGEGTGTPDGMKVDLDGHVFCGGPGGMWVISPEGEHLGTVVHGATQVNNIAFGGPDWKTLYFCSWSALFRLELLTAGVPVPRGTPVSSPKGGRNA